MFYSYKYEPDPDAAANAIRELLAYKKELEGKDFMLSKVVPKTQEYYVIKLRSQKVDAHRHSNMTDTDYNKRGGPGDYMVFTSGGDIIDILSEREFKDKYLVLGPDTAGP